MSASSTSAEYLRSTYPWTLRQQSRRLALLSTAPQLCREALRRNCNATQLCLLPEMSPLAHKPQRADKCDRTNCYHFTYQVYWCGCCVWVFFMCSCSVQYILNTSRYRKIYLLVGSYRCKKERGLIGVKVKKHTWEDAFIVMYVDIYKKVFLSCGMKATQPLGSACSVARITPERWTYWFESPCRNFPHDAVVK